MDAMKRVYISGPMTGFPSHNYPAFFEAEREWSAAGWLVSNPARNFGGRTDLDRTAYMSQDILLVHGADAVALLPGWEKSAGSKFEVAEALELGLPIYDAQTKKRMYVAIVMTAVVE